MKKLAFVLVVPVGAALVACGGGSTTTSTPAASPPTAVVSSTTIAVTTTTAAARTTPAVQPAPAMTTTAAAAPAIMPAVVCMNLQAAQNLIQSAGVFYSRSQDATGKGRAQISDRNWVVVSQTPAPGSPVTEGQAVLSVVKIGESTACG